MQQVGAIVTAFVYKCPLFVFSACMNRRVYLGANQSVEPLDCLHVPDDAIHPVDVEHDLPQGCERRQNVRPECQNQTKAKNVCVRDCIVYWLI